jgi:membrane-bound metal-dependent hydrolase YbcI (DUF457 family)
MKLPEHIAFSYLLAQLGAQQEYGPAGTALVIAAGLLPDLDGVTILGGWRCHRRYHRILGHGLPLTLGGPAVLTALAVWLVPGAALLPLWLWLQGALLAHLITDFLFYRWPVQLLWPLSTRGVGLGWVSWNDLVPTALLYGGCVLALLCPARPVAEVSLGLLAGYVAWRGVRSPHGSGWQGWVASGWARQVPRPVRWLTGDFIT